MDEEQWVCAKCGFTNEYYAAYCVSCSEIRPAGPVEPPAPAKQTPPADLRWDTLPPSATEELRRFAQQNAPSPNVPIPAPTRPSPEKRPFGLPRNLGKIPGLVILVIVIGVVLPLIGNIFDDVSTTETTAYWEWTDSGAADGDILAEVVTARQELLTAHQDKWQAWLTEGQGEIPSADYLVIDELLSLQVRIAMLSIPDSAEIEDLYWTWTTSLSKVMQAETTLAEEPNQANLDARTQAWADEAEAYQVLYDLYLVNL